MLIEIILFLSTFFPIFHILNALKPVSSHSINWIKDKHCFSILVPCYNEDHTIAQSIQSLFELSYSHFEVIYINDGSTDATLSELDKHLGLMLMQSSQIGKNSLHYYRSKRYANFYVIDKPNSGKGQALNSGLDFSHAPYVVTLDADSRLDRYALRIMNAVLQNQNIIAAGGSVHVVQSYQSRHFSGLSLPKQILVASQTLDYIRGFYIYKLSLSKQNATAIISGAFGVFQKNALLSVGGFRKSLGEDIDITIKLQQHIQRTKEEIVFIPSARCYTECPECIRDFVKQRIRWQKGFVDCLIEYAAFIFKSCFSKSLSFHLLFEAFFIGFSSSLLFLLTLLLVPFQTDSAFQANLLYYYGLSCAVFIIYTLISSRICRRYGNVKSAITPIIWLLTVLSELFFFRPLLIVIYLYGTFSYYWNNTSWNKIKRSKALWQNTIIKDNRANG